MKTNTVIYSIAALAILGTPITQGAEVFSTIDTIRINGTAPLGFSWSGHGQGGNQQYPLDYIAVTSTIEFDAAGSTIRVHGSIAPIVTTSTQSTTIEQIIGFGPPTPPIFPNPPGEPVPIYETGEFTGTMTVSIPQINFDTGIEPFTWNGTAYEFDSSFDTVVSALVTFEHSLVTGGENFTGIDQYTVPWAVQVGNRTIESGDYPNSLSFDTPLLLGPSQPFQHPSVVSNYSAVNGFELSVNAIVPEPSSLALFGLGGLALMRRRRK